jgi:hypothetical protein
VSARPRPELTFDRIVVGACYAERQVEISRELILAYCEAVGAGTERYRPAGDETHKVTIAPPSLPVIWTPPRVSFTDWDIPPGGIHTTERWENCRPIRTGETLQCRIVAQDKHTRDGKNHVVFEATFTSSAGELVARGLMSVIWQK